jgi:hypothetical protein
MVSSHVFYLLTLVFITWEFSVLIGLANPGIEKNPGEIPKYSGFYFLYFIWTLFGVWFFTDQSFLFYTTIILGLIPKRNKIWIKIDAIISILILLTILFNQYHFKKPGRIEDVIGFILEDQSSKKSESHTNHIIV